MLQMSGRGRCDAARRRPRRSRHGSVSLAARLRHGTVTDTVTEPGCRHRRPGAVGTGAAADGRKSRTSEPPSYCK